MTLGPTTHIEPDATLQNNPNIWAFTWALTTRLNIHPWTWAAGTNIVPTIQEYCQNTYKKSQLLITETFVDLATQTIQSNDTGHNPDNIATALEAADVIIH